MSVLNNGSVIFCNVSAKDSFSDKYQLVVNVSEDQAADAEAAGLNVKTKEFDGKPQFQIAFKTKFAVLHNIRGADGQTVLDLEGGELARGSVVNVQYDLRNWTGPTGNKGVSQDLTGIQVISRTSGGRNEFGDASSMGAAGGDAQDSDM